MNITIKDIVGIGIGPFNLGLAALTAHQPKLDTEFIERRDGFNWHSGMLLPGATLQVPFLADLVTMADPTHPLSYLNYLKQHDRLYQFYYYETFLVPRSEYNHYCQWSAEQLENCTYSENVVGVEYSQDNECFKVQSESTDGGIKERYSRNLAIGVGTAPWLPEWASHAAHPLIQHSAKFAHMREELAKCNSVTVVGSGQSAAECVLNLYRDLTDEQIKGGARVNWVTRSAGFHPMEASKLGQECFTPAYMDYFHTLSREKRRNIVEGQGQLYKGISGYTIADVFDLLYERSIGGREPGLNLYSNCQVNDIEIIEGSDVFTVSCYQSQQEKAFTLHTNAVICATGYTHQWPAWLEALKGSVLAVDEHGDLIVESDFSAQRCDQGIGHVFVQNPEVFQHGVGGPDLGIGAHRNASIINTMLGEEVYRLPKKSAFQTYGTPEAH
ncbi:L-lysine 6-monooxygenase (NADPH-requiring) [Vibrio sp. B1FIG11]|uniref:anguibactin biosynthesis histamine N-monooxygenase AngU n=1 Tax=Vibrio sp. B1FIG11 TaxID=2751177 RepID=UPI001AF7A209|nr:anguibactin biosynthesis histamine N-monooxygenase AngU [Vibrio sp. B1FIG11]CAD7810039.1 L-lysine 6-monooxygenase (NADPH-requiring) [Vibrio sp. B1FIG11]CAE6910975.1 L-lysine 6-monooxygenase (NADPH-requiring) [Vibrio sp. B1FIG11]